MPDAGRYRKDFIETLVAMKVRIDGCQPIQTNGNEAREMDRTDGLAGMKLLVLAHVSQVWGDQSHPRCAEFLGGRSGEGEPQKFRVRTIERADEDHRTARRIGREAEICLFVGEAPGFELPQLTAEGSPELLGRRFVAGQRENQGTGHRVAGSNRAGFTLVPQTSGWPCRAARELRWRSDRSPPASFA